MIDELSALKRIEEQFRRASACVDLGIGDDCAAVRFQPGNLVLSTTDSQVEGVHFLKSSIKPRDLARKAVAASLSDIGAMGGIPKFILASAGFSAEEDEDYLDDLIKGFQSAQEEFCVELVGGNLSSSKNLFLDITVLGEVEPESMVMRSGAKTGDYIYVSGTLGDSALGRTLIQHSVKLPNCSEEPQPNMITGNPDLIRRHIMPQPRLTLGRELAVSGLVTAMIDVSDGLIIDMERITTRQGLGARLFVDEIPTSPEYRERVSDYSEDYYSLALSGGEDYELLFASPRENTDLVYEICRRLDVRVTEIGRVVPENALILIDSNDEEIRPDKRGFVHFGT